MRTNEHQILEDEKAKNRHFRIGPLPQYARVLIRFEYGAVCIAIATFGQWLCSGEMAVRKLF
jgi:hypothetical protein